MGDAAYIMVSGECIAYRMVEGGAKSPPPNEARRRVRGAGGPFQRSARTATVEAVDRVSTLVVTRALLDTELGADSWVGALVRALADRFRDFDAQV